jgi:hypothetical protein
VSNIRIVKSETTEQQMHISAEAMRAKLEVMLAKNPIAIMIIAEVGQELHNDCLPDSAIMRRAFVRELHESYEDKGSSE